MHRFRVFMAASRQRRNVNARLDEDFIPWTSIADSEEEERERDRNLIESLVLVDNGERRGPEHDF